MSQVDEYVRAFDESNDYADAQAESLKQTALEDIDDLLRHTERRDVELWAALEADAESTVEDYENENDRSLDWILGFSGIAAAANTQFVLQNAAPLILNPVVYREQLLGYFELTTDEMVAAGKRGAVGPESASVSRFKPIVGAELESLAKLDTVELYRRLRGFGGLPAIERVTADAVGFVGRMTQFAKGSVQFSEKLSELVNNLAGRTLRGQQRRAIERVSTERQTRGDRNQLLVWMGEGGKRTCGHCLDRFGQIQTYAQWIMEGLPGADVCAGGDLCKCGLQAV